MKTQSTLKENVIQNLDIVLSVLGITLGFLAIILSETFHLNRSYLGIMVILGSLVFLINRETFTRSKLAGLREASRFLSSRFLPLVCFLLYAFLLTTGIFYHKLTSLYHRDSLYFVFFFSAALVTYLQIVFLDVRHFWIQASLLLEVLLLGISIRASAFYLYPSLSGNDPFYHQYLVQSLIANGNLPYGETYSSFPLFHLVIAIFVLLGISNINGGFFYVSILHCLALLAVFPLAKKYLNTRIGLIACLLLILSDYQVQWGVQIIPMTLGISLYVLVFVIILAIRNDKEHRYSGTIVLFLLGLAIIFSHTLSTLILIVSLACIWLIPRLLSLVKVNVEHAVRLTFILFLLVCTITYWGVFTEPQENSFFNKVALNIKYSLTEARLGETEVISHATKMNPLDVILYDAGWSVLLFLFTIGFLGAFAINPKKREALDLGLLAVFLIFVAYAGAIMGNKEVLPARWFSFAYFPVSILAGFSIFYMISAFLSSILRERKLLLIPQLLMIFGLGFVCIFLMITSPARSIPDSPFYLADFVEKPGFYQSEIVGMNYAVEKFPISHIAASSKTKRYIRDAIMINPEEAQTYSTSDVIVIRQSDFEKGFFIPYPKDQVNKYSLPTSAFLDFLYKNFYLIYDNGSVKIFGMGD